MGSRIILTSQLSLSKLCFFGGFFNKYPKLLQIHNFVINYFENIITNQYKGIPSQLHSTNFVANNELTFLNIFTLVYVVVYFRILFKLYFDSYHSLDITELYRASRDCTIEKKIYQAKLILHPSFLWRFFFLASYEFNMSLFGCNKCIKERDCLLVLD